MDLSFENRNGNSPAIRTRGNFRAPGLTKKNSYNHQPQGHLIKKSMDEMLGYTNKRRSTGTTSDNAKRTRKTIKMESKKMQMVGLLVQLPQNIEPYPSQKLMMVRMIQSLNNSQNALIESPTGSGKTLALLAASCAWLVRYKEQRAASKLTCKKHSLKNTNPANTTIAKADTTLNTSANSAALSTSTTADPDIITLDDDDHSTAVLPSEFSSDATAQVDQSIGLSKTIKSEDGCESSDGGEEDLEKHYMTDEEAEQAEEDSGSGKKTECTCLPVVRIYYGTRTHKQISQVTQEFGRLPFAEDGLLRHTILGSREQTCINDIVREGLTDLHFGTGSSAEPGAGPPSTITARCKELLIGEGNGCDYRNELRQWDRNPAKIRSIIQRNVNKSVWDLEDIVEALHNERPASMCPYFAATRTLTMDADILFCPFNYLLDPIIRASSEVYLRNSIVILDEAHNVEDTCRDAASFEFMENDLVMAMESLKQRETDLQEYLKDHCRRAHKSETAEGEDGGGAEEAMMSDKSTLEEFLDALQTAYHFTKNWSDFFKEFVHRADEALGKYHTQPQENEITYTFDSEELYAALEDKDSGRDLIMPENSARFIELRNAMNVISGRMPNNSKNGSAGDTSIASDQQTESVSTVKDQLLFKFRPSVAATVCIEKFLCFSHYFNQADNRAFYKCNIRMAKTGTLVRPTQGFGRKLGGRSQLHMPGIGVRLHHRPTQFNFLRTGEDLWHNSNAPPFKYEPFKEGYESALNLWCMFPSVACMDAFKDARTVILASGTLCPTETLKTELGIEFNAQMEGKQVISPERIFASVLSEGPTGQKLIATYRNIAHNSPFINELAQVIVSVCEIVPKGVLCFVSSYSVLSYIRDCLETSTFCHRLRAKKMVFEEPRKASDLQRTLDEYESAIRHPSQYGSDCDGALMLAVFRGKVSEGIDFMDDKARCVICVGIPYPAFKDELVVQKKRFNDENSKTMNILSGAEWYTTQAYRALNQALGRCLRHRMDWGALLLVDDRFVQSAKTADARKISKWVRDAMGVYKSKNGFADFENDLRKFVARMTTSNGQEIAKENF